MLVCGVYERVLLLPMLTARTLGTLKFYCCRYLCYCYCYCVIVFVYDKVLLLPTLNARTLGTFSQNSFTSRRPDSPKYYSSESLSEPKNVHLFVNR